MKYLLDSVIVIDHFNAIKAATQFLEEHSSECALSVITRAEVLAGFDVESHPLALELLDIYPTLPLTAESADLAARLRRTKNLKLPDTLQAAVAMHNKLVLVTRNSRDFRSTSQLKLLIPYRV